MLGRVIGDIRRLALVRVDPSASSLQIHRLVQAVIRSQMTEEELSEARHGVHKILAAARPEQGETDDPGKLVHLRHHLAAPGAIQSGGMRRSRDLPDAYRLDTIPVEARRVRLRPEPGEAPAESVG